MAVAGVPSDQVPGVPGAARRGGLGDRPGGQGESPGRGGRAGQGPGRGENFAEARGGGLDAGQLQEAERLLGALAGQLDSSGIATAGRFLLERVAPGLAEEEDDQKAERERKAALAGRELWFCDNLDGTVSLKGLLPTVEAEEVRRMVDAYANQARRAQAAADPDGELPPRSASRADGLVAAFRAAAASGEAPALGGDRPRVQVTMSYEDLLGRARGARLVGRDEAVPASELRVMLCDADILPVVLGSAGQVLDEGRGERLATAAIRAALALRDGGCAFPGCDVPAGLAEAHHLVPWHKNGKTRMSNLVLLCRWHHREVEPPDVGPPVWGVRLRDEDGLPEFVPPAVI
ncbi:MAG: DUF222 domain-containing protein, partial [Bifidobacteriaceae bacterium]|nr:DUF222 domain-containing protein [Bifidobacteriaceae bacterium]